jgi:hypothetical protein
MTRFHFGWLWSQDLTTLKTRSQFLTDSPGFCGVQRYDEAGLSCRSIIASVDHRHNINAKLPY